MFYENELRLFRNTFTKCHIGTFIVSLDEKIDNRLDLGLYRLLNIDTPKITYKELFPEVVNADIIKVIDNFKRNYILITLPEIKRASALIIGPFLNKEFNSNDILELSEQIKAPPKLAKDIENYYGSLPIILISSHLYGLIDAFAEHIYSTTNFKMIDVTKEYDWALPIISAQESITPEQTSWNMELMQKRYDYENELMEAVARGQEHKIDVMFSRFTSMPFERRLKDPVMNFKNYIIVMNTLLRKAAEQGGVHPVYLDKISSEFALQIEGISTITNIQNMMSEMFHAYCRLVKKHSLKNYSPAVGKIITIVEMIRFNILFIPHFFKSP